LWVPHFDVAIESGAFLKTLSTTDYVDQAFVCIRSNLGSVVSCYSRPTPFPAGVMELSRETGYQKTAGSFIAEQYPDVTNSDWHFKFGGTSRVDLMKQAVETCLYKF